MDVAVAGPRERLADVREWWRVQHPPPSLGRRLDLAYTTAITAAIVGAVAYGAAGSALADVMTPARLAALGPAAAIVALLLLARWGAYQGPVVFTVGDVGWLLSAPLPRWALAVRRLALALAIGAAGGAVVAGVLIVGVAGNGRGIAARDAAGIGLGAAALGVLGVAAAWAVECSARWERAVWLATWPAVAAAVGLAAWAPALPWWPLLAALTGASALAAAIALRAAGRCPTERHARRAEARESAVASIAGYDLRTARRSLEAAAPAGARARRGLGRRLPLPPIVWRDLVSAVRTPGRVLEAVVLSATAAALCARDGGRPLVVGAAMLAAYAAPARVMWPLRAELDVPDRPRALLRARVGLVIGEHTLLPAAVATAGALAGIAVCALTGRAAALPALTAVAFAPVATQCAAMSARRGGRLPQSVLATALAADPTGGAGALFGWFALWPAVTLVLGVPAVLFAAGDSTLLALFWIAIPATVLARLVAAEPS